MDLRLHRPLTLALIFAAVTAIGSLDAWPSGYSVSDQVLAQTMGERISRVPEFEFIREQSERLGVRAYLFGGTAAGYAHYVKWDLAREAGDPRYQPDRFDYDYTNIYRSNQDLDIVIDGPPDKAQQLQALLSAHYPYLQGSKPAWEVRLLREDLGDKQALLNNPDFLNQHTDSNSTGMVEITRPAAGEPFVKDLRDWESKDPYFLRDVNEGKIHYYFSDKHGTTSFARSGRNPPILSVVRYLTKAFQYDLELRPEDLVRVQKIIDAFDPRGNEMQNRYVRKWLLKKDNGRKLIQNAVNIEYAWNTLQKTGLREKLIGIENNPTDPGSLAWWLNKEPLRSRTLGIDPTTGLPGAGATAAELGIKIVSHETNGFLPYESITRAHTGDPNVLISRHGTAGESASQGNGFYTRKGTHGARGTGYTIRFEVDPRARVGADFSLHGDYVVFQNKSAFRVIPESLDLDVLQLFEMLSQGKEFDRSDRGILQKFKRRLLRKMSKISSEDERAIAAIALTEFAKGEPNPLLVETWFSLDFCSHYPAVTKEYLRSGNHDELFVKLALTQPAWKNQQNELVEKLVKSGRADAALVQYIFSQPEWRKRPDLLKEIIDRGRAQNEVLQFVLANQVWKDHPELLEQEIAKNEPQVDYRLLQYVLSQPVWSGRADLVEKIMNRGGLYIKNAVLEFILSQPAWRGHPELLEHLMSSELTSPKSIMRFTSHFKNLPQWRDHPELLEKLIDMGVADWAIVSEILSKPEWRDRPDILEKLIEKGTAGRPIVEHILSKPEWRHRRDLIVKVIEKGGADATLVQNILPRPEWRDRPDLIEKIIDRGQETFSVAVHILSQPEWKDRPDLLKRAIIQPTNRLYDSEDIAQSVLSLPQWRTHPAFPELFEEILKKGPRVYMPLAKDVLIHPDCRDRLKLLKALEKRSHLPVVSEMIRTLEKQVNPQHDCIVHALSGH